MNSSNTPFFSVVIPCHNAERYLRETLESVVGQSYSNFEVLVVDDCSTDTSREIVHEFEQRDSRFRLLSLGTRSGGPATPRNTGIIESKGKYVALLDADDIWDTNKLRNDAAFLETTNVDILYSGARYFRASKANVVHRLHPRRVGLRFLVCNHLPLLTICMRREILGPGKLLFDPDPNLVAIEDYNLLLRAHLQGKALVCRPGADAFYRCNADGSIYARGGFAGLMRRVYYNYAKLGCELQLSPLKLFTLMAASTAYQTALHIRGRV